MWYYIIGLVLAIAIFTAGFFVGKKHGVKVTLAAQSLKESIDRLKTIART